VELGERGMRTRGMVLVEREFSLAQRVMFDTDDICSVLHLAASNLTPQAYTFLTILLRNQHINVNLQDQESGYTALHRALFVGNIKAARDLLARGDTDLSIKDSEGLTAFDLYNGTIDGVCLTYV
jgi:ankyrin repeat protein